MNPAMTTPFNTYIISALLGCECSKTMPSTSMSARAMERPSVLRPGKSAAVAMVTADPQKLSVSPGLLSFEFLKSDELMFAELLQGYPFMKRTIDVAVGHMS
ncbi:hypothetical protein EUGRSUZ_G00032 [Eucalyptus grandis]|uniref:Uncharacterized protein n=2 Tax=Eucalyptus grandis TaxID=71139 RepID=A0ACC3K0F3_EUCGR|nr:hypothetical protein EUGRSUZ_G00032 [Eucalyptus grandis]